MTILTLNRKELEKKIGKVTSEIEEKITMFGTPIEYVNDDEIAVEVFPNRPDLLNLQNFARSFSQFLGKRKVDSFSLKKPEKDFSVKVEKSVKKVRPYTVCAVVKKLKLDDEKIKEIIDVQEKLHNSIGRKRKKLAIGIYPLDKIKLPIRFLARKPDEIKFLPLESPTGKEMTGKQILRNHPTGRDYSDLLENEEVYPIFVDGDDKILSMPPIINSHETGRIDDKTKEVFIECSGFNLHYLKKTLGIIISAFYEMGGEVYQMEIDDHEKGKFLSPEMDFEKMRFSFDDVNKVLGLDLKEKEIKGYLGRMGIGFESSKNSGEGFALIPPYRTDILHWVDLTEEIAIAYGYDNFEPVIPEISTIAEEDFSSRQKKIFSEILAGLGLLEVSSFHLNSKKDVKKIYHSMKNEEFIELEDSKTENDVLRVDLLTNLMNLFAENADASYPQKIFEIGKVFCKSDESSNSSTGIGEKEKIALAFADEKINFTDMKMVLDYFFKMIGESYELKSYDGHECFIDGRTAEIFVDGKSVGFVGEVNPRVLKNFKLKVPVVACEIDFDFLLTNRSNP